jgi:trans-aconitate methyltransferase
MNPIDRATIQHYHRHRIAAFGAGTRALGWRGEPSQHKRFEVIAAASDFNGATVLDVGCGLGDLKAYLDERFDGVRYLGVDQMPEFIAAASQRYAHCPRTALYCTDFSTARLPLSDVVVASGALGYRCAEPDFHFHMIRRMWAACAGVLVFNCLDEASFAAHPLLVGRNVADVMGLCRSLAGEVELVRGYLDDDFTVVMRRSTGHDPAGGA